MHKSEHRDDNGEVRYPLMAVWFRDPAGHRFTVHFPIPGTVVLTDKYVSPKRWKLGFLSFRRVFTETQRESLAKVVEMVHRAIDREIEHQTMMTKVFEESWIGPADKPDDKPDNTGQMFAAAAAFEVIDAFYSDP